MKTKKILIYTLLVGSIYFLNGCMKTTAENSFHNTPIEVKVEQIKHIDGNQEIAYSGTIEESESIPLSYTVIGNVTRVLVNEGDVVKKGDVLAILNNATYKNAYDMALATLKQAEDAHKRLKPMYENGNLPEIKFVEVETGLAQAKAATAIAKKNFDDCKLISPVNGIVGRRAIEPGMTVIPGMTAINIVKIKKVFARVSIAENEISSIKKGQKAKITIAALNNAKFTGLVEQIGVLADPLAHTYKIKIGIENKDIQIKPGMICNVALDKSSETSGLSVPSRAVLVDELGRNFVYAINQENAVKKYVKTGRLLKNGVEITDGLNYKEQIVVAGQQKLVDNSLIRIVN